MTLTNLTANDSKEPTNAVSVWADGVDAEIVARAIKDHSFVQGLEVEIDTEINVAPDGVQTLGMPVRVTIGKIAYLQNSSEEYVDCFWEVSIHPDDLKFIHMGGLSPLKLDPYIQGITYSFQDGVLEGYYRGYSTSANN